MEFVAFFILIGTLILNVIGQKSDKYSVNPHEYLFKYGYVGTKDFTNNAPIKSDTLKKFQKFAGLKVSGILDDQTINKMSLSRCGMLDQMNENHDKNPSWIPFFRKTKKKRLRWTLLKNSKHLTRAETLKILRKAFHYWRKVTKIRFVEVPEESFRPAQIRISFNTDGHGDPHHFDKKGGSLAHAYYPQNNNVGSSGDIHFDDDEDLKYGGTKAKQFFLWLATHEIGHSLGLRHTNKQTAVMNPWYHKHHGAKFHLHKDDISAIQLLYKIKGRKRTTMPPTKSNITQKARAKTIHPLKTLPKDNNSKTRLRDSSSRSRAKSNYEAKAAVIQKPDISCSRGGEGITAIYYSDRYKITFVFTKKNNIYFLSSNKNDNRQKSISKPMQRFSYFPAIMGNIDGIFSFPPDDTSDKSFQILFSGAEYFMYRDFAAVLKKPGPYSIHKDNPLNLILPKTVKKIDAAMTWYLDKKTYLFSGSMYWRYDSGKRKIDDGYPKSIASFWKGVPDNIDAAHSSAKDQTTYFITGNKLYLFNDRKNQVKAIYTTNQYLLCEEFGNPNSSLHPWDITEKSINVRKDQERPSTTERTKSKEPTKTTLKMSSGITTEVPKKKISTSHGTSSIEKLSTFSMTDSPVFPDISTAIFSTASKETTIAPKISFEEATTSSSIEAKISTEKTAHNTLFESSTNSLFTTNQPTSVEQGPTIATKLTSTLKANTRSATSSTVVQQSTIKPKTKRFLPNDRSRIAQMSTTTKPKITTILATDGSTMAQESITKPKISTISATEGPTMAQAATIKFSTIPAGEESTMARISTMESKISTISVTDKTKIAQKSTIRPKISTVSANEKSTTAQKSITTRPKIRIISATEGPTMAQAATIILKFRTIPANEESTIAQISKMESKISTVSVTDKTTIVQRSTIRPKISTVSANEKSKMAQKSTTTRPIISNISGNSGSTMTQEATINPEIITISTSGESKIAQKSTISTFPANEKYTMAQKSTTTRPIISTISGNSESTIPQQSTINPEIITISTSRESKIAQQSTTKPEFSTISATDGSRIVQKSTMKPKISTIAATRESTMGTKLTRKPKISTTLAARGSTTQQKTTGPEVSAISAASGEFTNAEQSTIMPKTSTIPENSESTMANLSRKTPNFSIMSATQRTVITHKSTNEAKSNTFQPITKSTMAQLPTNAKTAPTLQATTGKSTSTKSKRMTSTIPDNSLSSEVPSPTATTEISKEFSTKVVSTQTRSTEIPSSSMFTESLPTNRIKPTQMTSTSDEIPSVIQKESGTSESSAAISKTVKKEKAAKVVKNPALRCSRGEEGITAIYYSGTYKITFVFTKENNIYFLSSNKNDNSKKSISKPMQSSSYFPAIVGKVDAIFTMRKTKGNSQFQIIFSAASFFIYRDFAFVLKKPGPYSIHKDNPLNLKLPKIVKKIDAAMTWYLDKKTYLFSGSLFWRYDNRKRRMDDGYPKPTTSFWKGVPENIDAAHSFAKEQTTYFIAGNKLYLFDDRTLQVKSIYTTDQYLLCEGTKSN